MGHLAELTKMAENNQNKQSPGNSEYSSWISRTKYSSTVCYRLEPMKNSLFPISRASLDREAHQAHSRPTTSGSLKPPLCLGSPPPPRSSDTRYPSSRSRPLEFSLSKQKTLVGSPGPQTTIPETFSFSNQRTLGRRYPSPEPQTKVPETFKEAKSRSKRFSSPQRKSSDNILNKAAQWARYSTRGRKLIDILTQAPSSSPTSPIFGFLSPSRSPDFIGKAFKNSPSWSKYIQQSEESMTAVGTAQDWMVDLSKLFVGQRFASGAHSRLYHGIYNEKPVAVKVIRQPDGDENEDMALRLEKQFDREVAILSHLHHRNIVQLVAACRRPPVFCVITEYLSGGSLRSFLHKREPGSVSPKEFVSIALDIARGMEYLHSQGVIHRDLKSENLLFTGDMCLKVVDFGIACEEINCDYLNEDRGTYRWMAPEVINHKPHNRKADVYSFGIVLWEIITGRAPYEDITPVQAAFAVVHKNARPTFPEHCLFAIQKLIEKCWVQNPEKRPEFWEIVSILEQFEASLLFDGTLNMRQNVCSNEWKHRLPIWFQWLGIRNPGNATISPSPPK